MTGSSWHPGCPVRIGDLRVLHMNERGFDGNLHPGELIVNRDSASAVLGVFRELFLARFPIQRMRPVDAYGGSDARSMAADNTSGFNCRYVPGSPGVWSQHAYGHAVDINPLRNPYVTSAGNVMPPRGARFTDRSLPAPGMIRSGGVVVRAFASIGWGWGGGWNGSPDYQHFSATGSAR